MFNHRCVLRVVAEYLLIDAYTPFSQITDLSKFGSSIIHSTPQAPRVAWVSDMEILVVDGEHLSISEFRVAVRRLVSDTTATLSQLTGDKNIPQYFRTPIKEDLRNKQPGYSFLKDSRFDGLSEPFLRLLVEDGTWRIGQVYFGTWIWNRPAIRRFFFICATLLNNISVLLNVTRTYGNHHRKFCSPYAHSLLPIHHLD